MTGITFPLLRPGGRETDLQDLLRRTRKSVRSARRALVPCARGRNLGCVRWRQKPTSGARVVFVLPYAARGTGGGHLLPSIRAVPFVYCDRSVDDPNRLSDPAPCKAGHPIDRPPEWRPRVLVVRHVDLDHIGSPSTARSSPAVIASYMRISFPCAGVRSRIESSVLLSSSLHGYAVQTVHFTHQRPPRFSARSLPRRIRESTASGLM